MSNLIKITLLRIEKSDAVHMLGRMQAPAHITPTSLCGIEFWWQGDYEEEIEIKEGDYSQVTCGNCYKVLRSRGVLKGIKPIRDTQESIENKLTNLSDRLDSDIKKHQQIFGELSRSCECRSNEFHTTSRCTRDSRLPGASACTLNDCPLIDLDRFRKEENCLNCGT